MAPNAKTSTNPKLSTGPSKALVERINHLKNLFEHLPDSVELPLDPNDSKYTFYLDSEILSEDPSGMAALSRCFEVAFDTWRQPDSKIKLTERGHRLSEDLIKFLKEVVKKDLKTDIDHAVFKDAWLEWLIQSAVHAGAKIPSCDVQRKRKADGLSTSSGIPEAQPVQATTGLVLITTTESDSLEQPRPSKKPRNTPIIIDSDSDDFDCDIPAHVDTNQQATSETRTSASSWPTASSLGPFGDWRRPINGTQRTLGSVGWKKWAPGEREAFLKREAATVAEHRDKLKAREMRKKEEADDRN